MTYHIITYDILDQLGVECFYIPNFLSNADEYYKILDSKFPFHQEQITAHGKTVDQPRLTRFMGDKGKSFRYSGFDRKAVEWIPEILELREKVMELVLLLRPDHPVFNVVLGNQYKTGQNKISAHSDAETEHNKDCFIASVSLGAERDFVIHSKETGKQIMSQKLAHGSLFLMGRKFQDKLKHSLPIRKKVKDARQNYTFRCFQ